MSALLAAATETATTVTTSGTDTGGGEATFFWIVAPLMVIGALGLVFARKAVHAALSMAAVMVLLGAVYLVQQAPLLGAVQIFVYTGAVMMLFLFVVMLIGVDSSDSLVETIKGQRPVAALLGLGLVVMLFSVLGDVAFPDARGLTDINADPGNITSMAGEIFGTYVWAFEATSALLITAAVGAMMLAHRERLAPRPTQRQLADRRIREGAVKAPLPAPGVFARHNAVDTPALLPDGTPSELSVSRVLSVRGQMRGAGSASVDVAELADQLSDPMHEVPETTEGTSVDSATSGTVPSEGETNR